MSIGESRAYSCCLESFVLATWWRFLEPRCLLDIFGQGSDRVRPITEPDRELRRQEERTDPGPGHVDDNWTEANVCWGSLDGDSVS